MSRRGTLKMFSLAMPANGCAGCVAGLFALSDCVADCVADCCACGAEAGACANAPAIASVISAPASHRPVRESRVISPPCRRSRRLVVLVLVLVALMDL